MTIPRISPYALPTQLPQSRVPWTFDTSRAALLIHDAQRYFLDFYSEPFEELLAHITALRGIGLPTVYSAQPPKQTAAARGLLTDRWGPGLQDRDEIVAQLAPADDDMVITKHRYSAFFATELAQWLADQGRDQLVICGVYAHIGITATALDAFSRDIETFVVADAIADFSPQWHNTALEHLAMTCAQVVTTSQLSNDETITLETVRQQVLALLDDPVSDDDNLIDAGLDSIRVMGLIEDWKSAGAEVTFTDLAAEPTIRGFHAAVAGA